MKKGFTLIELLAVIVILAVLALIATPVVLNIINGSKENTLLRSADFYLDAVDQAVTRKNLTTYFAPTSCEIQNNGNLICDENEEVVVDVSGEKPTSGQIVFSDGKVTSAQMTISNQEIVMNEGMDLEYKLD